MAPIILKFRSAVFLKREGHRLEIIPR
jgi:hypothetical protein